MKFSNKLFILAILLFWNTNLQSQTNYTAIENALLIARKNKRQLENVGQLLVVYNKKPENFRAVFVALEKKTISGL